MSGDAGQSPEINLSQLEGHHISFDSNPQTGKQTREGVSIIRNLDYREQDGQLIVFRQPRWKRFWPPSSRLVAVVGGATTAALLAAYVLAPSVFGKLPMEAGSQNLPPTKGITAIGTLPTETSVTGELVVKAPTSTPTEQPATATPKKEATPTTKPAPPTEKPTTAPLKKDSPTPAQKEPTPTTTPAESTSMPLEIPYEKGKTIEISAKETITRENFNNYFEPVSDKKELGKLLNGQGRPLYPEFEELVQIKNELLTYRGSVTLRAPSDVKKILNWDQYQDLLDRYIGGSHPETPINYIAYTKPGEGELRFIIGRIDSTGKLELVVRAPLEAEKATTYHRKVGDSVERLAKLVTIGEHKGGKIIEFDLPVNTISTFLRGKTKEMEGSLSGGVTFVYDPRYFGQINNKAAVPVISSVK